MMLTTTTSNQERRGTSIFKDLHMPTLYEQFSLKQRTPAAAAAATGNSRHGRSRSIAKQLSPTNSSAARHRRRSSLSPVRAVQTLLGKVIKVDQRCDRPFCSSSITMPDFEHHESWQFPSSEVTETEENSTALEVDDQDEQPETMMTIRVSLATPTLRRHASTDSRPSLPTRRPSNNSTASATPTPVLLLVEETLMAADKMPIVPGRRSSSGIISWDEGEGSDDEVEGNTAAVVGRRSTTTAKDCQNGKSRPLVIPRRSRRSTFSYAS